MGAVAVNDMWLIFEFDRQGKLDYQIRFAKKTLVSEQTQLSDQKEIEQVIDKATKLSADQNKTLRKFIKADGETTYPVFKNLVAALRAKEIYKYQLITTPE